MHIDAKHRIKEALNFRGEKMNYVVDDIGKTWFMFVEKNKVVSLPTLYKKVNCGWNKDMSRENKIYIQAEKLRKKYYY